MECAVWFFKDGEKIIAEMYHPDGYNIGINEGEAAGQTIFHLHIHIIPRHKGDVDNPRGGVRNIKKPLVKYLNNRFKISFFNKQTSQVKTN